MFRRVASPVAVVNTASAGVGCLPTFIAHPEAFQARRRRPASGCSGSMRTPSSVFVFPTVAKPSGPRLAKLFVTLTVLASRSTSAHVRAASSPSRSPDVSARA